MKTKISIYIALLVTFYSCDSFLDVEPKGLSIPNTVEEYDKMLNSSSLLLMGIDLYNPDLEPEASKASNLDVQAYNAARWNSDFSQGGEDMYYNGCYADINIANVILKDVDEVQSVSNDETLRRNVKGQAYARRAISYYLLANLYCKNYDSSTANTDRGVPIVVEPDINQATPVRSVQQVYDTIIYNLEKALDYVPQSTKAYVNKRASRPAVLSLLAKTYMQMNRFDLALPYAKEAYESYDFMYNLNQHMVVMPAYHITTLPMRVGDFEEFVWSRSFVNMGNAVASNDFMSIMDQTNDQRFKVWYSNLLFGRPVSGFYTPHPFGGSIGITSPEIYLMYAECLTRDNQLAKAIEVMERFIVNRYAPGTLSIPSDILQNDLLNLVLKERRLELAGGLTRWFDIKRFLVEGRTVPTYTRTVLGETYTIEPQMENYVLDLPAMLDKYLD